MIDPLPIGGGYQIAHGILVDIVDYYVANFSLKAGR